MTTLMDELQTIFRDVFDDEDLRITETTTAIDVDEWDSLAHIRLIIGIEKHFSLHFDALEISRLENVGQMAELILHKKKND